MEQESQIMAALRLHPPKVHRQREIQAGADGNHVPVFWHIKE